MDGCTYFKQYSGRNMGKGANNQPKHIGHIIQKESGLVLAQPGSEKGGQRRHNCKYDQAKQTGHLR